jgi:hypothetical protein
MEGALARGRRKRWKRQERQSDTRCVWLAPGRSTTLAPHVGLFPRGRYNALTVCSLAPHFTTGVLVRISNLTVKQCILMRKKGMDWENTSEYPQSFQLLVFSMVVGLSKGRFLNLEPGPLSEVSR